MDKQSEVAEELIRVAKARETTTYKAIAQLMGIALDGDWAVQQVSDMLDRINKSAVSGTHMLSAVVISEVNNRPGEGFFGLARSMGKYTGGDKDAFWVDELKRVHDHWANEAC